MVFGAGMPDQHCALSWPLLQTRPESLPVQVQISHVVQGLCSGLAAYELDAVSAPIGLTANMMCIAVSLYCDHVGKNDLSGRLHVAVV